MTMPEACKDFHKFFPEKPLNDFLDAVLSYISKSPKMDIAKFDEFIHSKHGDYENENMNMGELIEQQYGKEAKDFIEGLI